MIEFAEDNARKPGVLFTDINDNNTDVYEDGVHIGYIYRTTDNSGDECWVYYDFATWKHLLGWAGRNFGRCKMPIAARIGDSAGGGETAGGGGAKMKRLLIDIAAVANFRYRTRHSALLCF